MKTIQMVAHAMQLSMIAVDGRDAFTGHVWRISGSRLLARLGIQIALIMLLARWGSATIMRYVKDAPLKALASDYKKAIKGKLAAQSASSSSSAEAPREKLKDDVLAKVNSILADTKKIEDDLTSQIEHLTKKLSSRRAEVHQPYAISHKYNQWHRVYAWKDKDPSEWRAWCSWKYGPIRPAEVRRRSVLEEGVEVCWRCFPEMAPVDE